MLEIRKMTPGPYLPVEVDGTVVQVGSYQADLAVRARDATATIALVLGEDNQVNEATGPGGWWVANIIIPPTRYTEEQTGTDDDGEPIISRLPLPLDMRRVVLNLWGLPPDSYIGHDDAPE